MFRRWYLIWIANGVCIEWHWSIRHSCITDWSTIAPFKIIVKCLETNMWFGVLHFFFICKLSSVFGSCSRLFSSAVRHGPRQQGEDGTRGRSCWRGCVGIAAYYKNMSTNSIANSFHDFVRLVDLQSSECGPRSLRAQNAGWTPNVKPYRGTSPCQQQGAVGKRKLPQHQVGGDRGAGLFRIYVAQRNCFSWYLCTTSEK